MAMKPYHEIFPGHQTPVLNLEIPRKTRGVPKGSYRFADSHCIEPGCDCRRVTVSVSNEKMKPKATICFGFDQQGPFAGPYLDPSAYQAPYAAALLELFVAALNYRPDRLDLLYAHYREVREGVEGKPYRGRPFPKPGSFVYRATPPPDLEAVLEQSLKKMGREKSAGKPGAGGGAAAKQAGGAPAAVAAAGMAQLVDLYVKVGSTGPVGRLLALQDELRRFLVLHEEAGEAFAALLSELSRRSPPDDEKLDAALRALCDVIDFYDVELQGERPGARLRMDGFQRALARRVFEECDDAYLKIAVSNILLHSRVKLHPALLGASRSTVVEGVFRPPREEEQGEDLLTGIARGLQSRRVSSPFEGMRQMFEFFAVNDPELQLPVIAEMMTAQQPLLRDIAALMLFHPRPAVSQQAAQLLSRIDGAHITPETLRRLIVSRNWFPDPARRNVDQAITNARKAHVECAHLGKPPALTVYAGAVEGTGGQGFHIVVPEGAGCIAGTVVLKKGMGVANSYESVLPTRRQMERFLADVQKGYVCLECSADYLDLRVCHALADGTANGVTPNHWLVRIAELSGRDRWKGAPLDPGNELLLLRDELAARDPRLLEEKEYLGALGESADWLGPGKVLGAWFEDDDAVQEELASFGKGGAGADEADAVERLVDRLLEARREPWLERLVIDTLWLKHAARPPVAWHKMYHVAQAVADATVALKEIPLLVSIARCSLQRYKRIKSGRNPRGGEA